MLRTKAIASLALLTTMSLTPMVSDARNVNNVDCAYTISQTWYGKCRVSINQGAMNITTSNGHNIRIRYNGWLNANQENRVTIDGSSGTAFWNTGGCEFGAWKSNGSFSVNLYGSGMCNH